MRRYDAITEICDAMVALGWGPHQTDHEDANGQFEMSWDYAEALVTHLSAWEIETTLDA